MSIYALFDLQSVEQVPEKKHHSPPRGLARGVHELPLELPQELQVPQHVLVHLHLPRRTLRVERPRLALLPRGAVALQHLRLGREGRRAEEGQLQAGGSGPLVLLVAEGKHPPVEASLAPAPVIFPGLLTRKYLLLPLEVFLRGSRFHQLARQLTYLQPQPWPLHLCRLIPIDQRFAKSNCSRPSLLILWFLPQNFQRKEGREGSSMDLCISAKQLYFNGPAFDLDSNKPYHCSRRKEQSITPHIRSPHQIIVHFPQTKLIEDMTALPFLLSPLHGHHILPALHQQIILLHLMRSLAPNPQALLNSNVLKTMKQQVLRQAYEQQLNKKTERTTMATNLQLSERDSAKSIIGSRSLGDLTTRNRGKHSLLFEGGFPAEVPSDRSRKTLMDEKDQLSRLESYQSFELERQRSVREEYKRQLQEEIKRKQSVRELNKITEKEEERSKLNRQDSIRNKQSSFKEFYDNANRFRDNAAQGYLQYVSKSKEREEREREKERQDLQRNRNLLKVQLLEQYKSKREKREQLKRSLQQQIVENQHYRRQERSEFKNRGYQRYDAGQYNPIYNPIDFKMDLNNKYVLQQLIQHSS